MSANTRRYKRRRRNRTPLFLLLLLLVTGMVLLLISCGGKDGENPGDSNDPIQGGAADPGEGGEPDPPEPVEPEPDPYEGYAIRTMTERDMGIGEQILVSNAVPYTFPAEAAEELVVVIHEKNNSYMSKDYETSLLPVTVSHLNDMMKDYTDQGGAVNIMVVSGHRTYDFQQKVFDSSAARNGLEHAQRFVAQPGGSEHHTGLVVDFSILHADGSSEEYQGQGEYAWINENCQDYGYVVRYETGKEDVTGIWDEPWHFRYIGIPHATEAASQGLCLEEYIDYLRQFPFEGDHLMIDCADGRYEVWYTQGSSAYLPDSGEYTVSGNNVDGVVVTCKVG